MSYVKTFGFDGSENRTQVSVETKPVYQDEHPEPDEWPESLFDIDAYAEEFDQRVKIARRVSPIVSNLMEEFVDVLGNRLEEEFELTNDLAFYMQDRYFGSLAIVEEEMNNVADESVANFAHRV